MQKKPKQWQFGIKKSLKLDYKLNLHKAFAVILPKIMKMLFCSHRILKNLTDFLIKVIQKYKSAIRKGRTFKRIPNKSKHSVNYKRNFLLS